MKNGKSSAKGFAGRVMKALANDPAFNKQVRDVLTTIPTKEATAILATMVANKIVYHKPWSPSMTNHLRRELGISVPGAAKTQQTLPGIERESPVKIAKAAPNRAPMFDMVHRIWNTLPDEKKNQFCQDLPDELKESVLKLALVRNSVTF